MTKKGGWMNRDLTIILTCSFRCLFLHRVLREPKRSYTFCAAPSNLNQRDEEPERIERDEVDPEVEGLGPAVDGAVDGVVEEEDDEVQYGPVQLAEADDDLQRVAEWVVLDHKPSDQKGQRAPRKCGDRFHTHGKRVTREVSRVRLRVLFPQLSKEIGPRWHRTIIVREVTCQTGKPCVRTKRVTTA